MSYRGLKSGKLYELGSLIATGGEGTVYACDSHRDKAVKIYHQRVDQLRAEKLQALVALGKPQLASVSAWPEEIITDERRTPVGFAMPAVRGGKPLHLLITPSDRQRYAPHLSYADLVVISANLARAVATFHQAGVVLADINFSNFLVLVDGTVRVIDCDSMQIGTKAKFRSTVAMEEFVPPELQGKRMADVQRTADHDAYGLSVLIFLLLVMGRHPCSGYGATPLGQAIAGHMHPFGSRHSKTCPFCVLGIKPLEVMSSEMRSLFKAAFGGGGVFSRARPSAVAWERELAAFRKSLIVCKANAAHAYSPEAKSCPWCRIEASGRPPLFTPTLATRLPRPTERRKGLLSALVGA